ncbi:MAG: T9SS type A sorting domain-containing protein [Lewinellaceae bacterium]|nr:T9SS type A sorting domain-containing protein [Lewinellaceae bacterium]
MLDSPSLRLTFDNLAPGEATALGRVRLAIPVPELYALAFSLEYDTAYFEIIRGEPSGYDFEERSFRSGVRHPARPGDFDFARASTGGDIEVGLMTLLYIKVKEAFTYPLPADTSLIRFKNIKAIRADGTEIEIGGTAVVARFQGIVVDTEEPPVAQDIRLFPNPTTGRLELRFPGHQLDGIEVLDATGKRVWRQSSRLADAASLELPKLSAGIYFVRMRLGENVVVRKVVVRR